MNKKQNSIALSSASLHVSVRPIGNSRGVVIPKVILEQLGIEEEVDMTVEDEKIILSKPKNPVRRSWANDAKAIALAGEDKLIAGDFNNDSDGDWVW
jgi:antitoxin MazE